MIGFTFRMFLSDMKQTFHGWKALLIIPVVAMLCIPFLVEENEIGPLSYWLLFLWSIMRPRLSKIHHVVPITDKLLKTYVWVRTWMINTMLILWGLACYYIFPLLGTNQNKGGFLNLLFFQSCNILLAHTVLINNRKKDRWYQMVLYIGIFAIEILNGVMFSNEGNFVIRLLINIIGILIMQGYLWLIEKDVVPEFYVKPPYSLWGMSNTAQEDKR